MHNFFFKYKIPDRRAFNVFSATVPKKKKVRVTSVRVTKSELLSYIRSVIWKLMKLRHWNDAEFGILHKQLRFIALELHFPDIMSLII